MTRVDQMDLYSGPEPEKGDWIADLRAGQGVDGLFAVQRAGTRPRRNGEPFLTLDLSDRTGRIGAVGWDHAHLADRILEGGVIHIRGQVDAYQGSLQIKIDELETVTGSVPPEFFVAAGPQDREVLAARLEQVRAGVTTPHLKALLDRLFDDDGLREAYLRAPAAKLRHQAYVGGLAEHSLNMAEHARYCAGFYPELDGDLLVTAALLHDIGKIYEYRMDVVIDYSDEGRLVGHIVIGERMVRQAAGQVPDFPESVLMHLSHLILSHQGRLEHASPVTPMTLEALVLFALDSLDSRVATFRDIRSRHEGQERRWSEWDRLDEQFWFLGNQAHPGSGSTEE
jgi:3'-5' exoribonuclease